MGREISHDPTDPINIVMDEGGKTFTFTIVTKRKRPVGAKPRTHYARVVDQPTDEDEMSYVVISKREYDRLRC